MRATPRSRGRQGSSWNVAGSGMAIMSDSSMRAKPSMLDAVEALALFERLLQLLDGDREALQRAEDVGEPEADELDVVVAAGLEYVVFLVVHGASKPPAGHCSHGPPRRRPA